MDVEQLIANAQAEAEGRSLIASGHPTDTQLCAYLHADLDGEQRRRIGAHLGSCPNCRTELASLRRALAEVEVLLPTHLDEPLLDAEFVTPSSEGWRRRIERFLRPIFGPRRWAWHAAVFVAGSTALFGLNSYLHAEFTPTASPFGSPPSPPWWAEWWTPYAIGFWAALLALHGLLVGWRRRNNGQSRANKSDQD